MKACFNNGMDYEKLIYALGGPSEVARLCEVAPQAVSQWFGTDPKTGESRVIPKARLMFLKAVRPELFATENQISETSPTEQGASHG
jgi:hypothetical protein